MDRDVITRSERNQKKKHKKVSNYDHTIVVTTFEKNTVEPGQYEFPFELLLPSLPGSYFRSATTYIKYTLIALLIPASQYLSPQQCQIDLNVVELPRSHFRSISTFDERNAKCCCCCMSYGTVSIVLNCDKNFAFTGDVIRVNGKIDNSLGKAII
jgi:hypothetical protein